MFIRNSFLELLLSSCLIMKGAAVGTGRVADDAAMKCFEHAVIAMYHVIKMHLE